MILREYGNNDNNGAGNDDTAIVLLMMIRVTSYSYGIQRLWTLNHSRM